jgi:hypothetical protein
MKSFLLAAAAASIAFFLYLPEAPVTVGNSALGDFHAGDGVCFKQHLTENESCTDCVTSGVPPSETSRKCDQATTESDCTAYVGMFRPKCVEINLECGGDTHVYRTPEDCEAETNELFSFECVRVFPATDLSGSNSGPACTE